MPWPAIRKILILAALASAALPRPVAAYVADDVDYAMSCNADGYVLTSKHPVARTLGDKTASGIEKLYLGKSCDAYHRLFGQGTWCWANGGFQAEFPGHRFGFPRQEPSCAGAEAYEGVCGCR